MKICSQWFIKRYGSQTFTITVALKPNVIIFHFRFHFSLFGLIDFIETIVSPSSMSVSIWLNCRFADVINCVSLIRRIFLSSFYFSFTLKLTCR